MRSLILVATALVSQLAYADAEDPMFYVANTDIANDVVIRARPSPLAAGKTIPRNMAIVRMGEKIDGFYPVQLANGSEGFIWWELIRPIAAATDTDSLTIQALRQEMAGNK